MSTVYSVKAGAVCRFHTNKSRAKRIECLIFSQTHFQFSPARCERREDIEPNLAYELNEFSQNTGRKVAFYREARERLLDFATSADAAWAGNCRELNAAVMRLSTLAAGRRITKDLVDEEIVRLREAWADVDEESALLNRIVTSKILAQTDLFDRVQLAGVLKVCQRSTSLSDAGRKLFAMSRKLKATVNDADRLRKYLQRFDLTWSDVTRRS